MKILVTGTAGFIGFHVAKALLERGDEVIGVDNFNPYYDIRLKEDRNEILEQDSDYRVYRADLVDFEALSKIFKENGIQKICHLAAQAGVRYSLENPLAYERSNNEGFLRVLELARDFDVRDVIFASSSSVYGGNEKIPFSEEDRVDKPISLYAATKRYNELLAHTYHHLFGMNITGLRFFTVYGPWGRPDMALFKFVKAIREDRPIDVYNHGNMKRDFTYIDDIVDGVVAAIDNPQPYEIFNLGNNNPVELTRFIEVIEEKLDKKAQKNLLPLQPGDVPETYADISRAQEILGYEPRVSIEEGIGRFTEWYNSYFA